MTGPRELTPTLMVILGILVSKCSCLRLVMLDVPSPTVVGESVELTCSFDLENKKLYAVKWYKNNLEFFRYVPSNYPPSHIIPMPGIKVDASRSNEHNVYLKHVDLNTAGNYRCEVSADEPYFEMADAQKDMNVLVLPAEGPKIAGGRQRYQVGEPVTLNCTSVKSKPPAILKWFINDEPATVDYEEEYSTTLHDDGLETSSLSLRFVVSEKHFKHGNMRLKCTATISRMYTMSDEEHAFLGQRQNSGFHIDEGMLKAREEATSPSSGSKPSVFSLLCFLLSCLV